MASITVNPSQDLKYLAPDELQPARLSALLPSPELLSTFLNNVNIFHHHLIPIL